MGDVADLDRQIAANVRAFELGQLHRRKLSSVERDTMLTDLLGPKTQPVKGEGFVVGDAAAGVTSKSAWFAFRRVHFATLLSIAVGELRDGENRSYCVDLNCTARRSFRISLSKIVDADNFLVGLAQFTSFKIVPTLEEEIEEQQQIERNAAASEANAERRQRRMELLAVRQQQLLDKLIQVESAPRVSFGVIY